MAGWIVLAFWMAANCNSARPSAFNHLRSNETFLRDVVIEGYARSGTFRDLVDATERLSCIVYVTIAVNMPAGMRGALLLRPAGRREMPILRVVLKSNLSREEAIATIAHELQHVVEAVTTIPASGQWNMSAAFDKLDPARAHTTGVHVYETDAAVKVSRTVRNELRHARTRPKC